MHYQVDCITRWEGVNGQSRVLGINPTQPDPGVRDINLAQPYEAQRGTLGQVKSLYPIRFDNHTKVLGGLIISVAGFLCPDDPCCTNK